MLRLIAFTTLAVPILAILFGVIEDAQYISRPKPKSLGAIQDRRPSKTDDFGRFTKPLDIIDYSWVSSSKLFNFTAFKHWDFRSICTSKYYIGVAIADFNYIGNAFFYIIDRTDPNKKFYQYASKSILAQAITEQAGSSISGCTQYYKSSTEYIRFCYNKDKKIYEVDANVPIDNDLQVAFNFQFEYSDTNGQSMVLIYPVEQDRPVYTHKLAALPAHGKIKIGNKEQEILANGLSNLDWTLGYSERVTIWKWASLSTIATNPSNNESVTIGINLSDVVYNDVNGISMESAVWIAGRVYTTNKIIFQFPEDHYLLSRVWEMHSSKDTDSSTPKLNLKFQPWGSHKEHINAFLIGVDFVQAFGVYSGTIELLGQTYIIENGFGVAEKHYSKW